MPRGFGPKRCPHCQGSNTKRHGILVLKKVTLQGIRPQGVQRWYCKDCRRAFTPEHAGTGKYTREVQEQAAMLYFDQGASYRAVARGLLRMGISNIDAKGCWSLVQRLASNCKAPWEISLGFNPRWSGYLAVDGDSIPIASHRQSIPSNWLGSTSRASIGSIAGKEHNNGTKVQSPVPKRQSYSNTKRERHLILASPSISRRAILRFSMPCSNRTIFLTQLITIPRR